MEIPMYFQHFLTVWALRTHIEIILEGVASSSLDISPWGAMTDPIVPDFMKNVNFGV